MNAGKRVFVDTNVLLYLVDRKDRERQARSAQWLDLLWQKGNGALSWQVLHEFYTNAVGKMKTDHEEARFLAGAFLDWRPVDSSPDLIQRAWRWMDTAGVSYWDALIVAAAEVSGSEILLSEDFQTGRRFGRIRVVNPFVTPPESLDLRG